MYSALVVLLGFLFSFFFFFFCAADPETCHVHPSTAKSWTLASNMTIMSDDNQTASSDEEFNGSTAMHLQVNVTLLRATVGVSKITLPEYVQFWIYGYLALNIVWFISVAPLIIGNIQIYNHDILCEFIRKHCY